MIVEWFAKRWAKKNLTTENLKKGFEGFCEWVADPLIREALGRLVRFCVEELLKEIKEKAK